MVLLVLAGCQDSGPFGLDGDVEKGPAFELFDGGWAAVHDPSRPVHNGGFESGFFAPEWTATITGGGVGLWKIGAKDLSPVLPAADHSEDLPNSGLVGVSASGVNGAVLTLSQIVDLPPISGGAVINLA